MPVGPHEIRRSRLLGAQRSRSEAKQTEKRAPSTSRVKVFAVVEPYCCEERELKPPAVPCGRPGRPAPSAVEALSEGPDLGAHLPVALSNEESRVEFVGCGVEVVGIAS